MPNNEAPRNNRAHAMICGENKVLEITNPLVPAVAVVVMTRLGGKDKGRSAVQYTEIPPSFGLEKFVKCFWSAELTAPNGIEVTKTILPDGTMELLTIDGDVTVECSNPKRSMRRYGTFVVGQLRRPISLKHRGKISITGVRFQPAGASAFLSIPMHHLVDTIVPIGELNTGRLELHLRACPHGERKIKVLESWLHDRLSHRFDDGITAPAVASILNRRGCGLVNDVAGEIGITARHLERRFHDTVGLSPKLLSRIVRFSNAFEQIKTARRVRWPEIAFDSGFCDQAHFIREFRHFSGQVPSSVSAASIDAYWCANPASPKNSSVMSGLFNIPSARCA